MGDVAVLALGFRNFLILLYSPILSPVFSYCCCLSKALFCVLSQSKDRQTFYLKAKQMLTSVNKVKKSIITFIVAFSLSIGFTVLPLVTRASLSVMLQSNIAQSLSINTLISIFFSLIGLAVFFVIFYLLANNIKILAVKSTIIALLLGVTIGPAILYLINIFLYNGFLIYLSMAANSAVSSVFLFFLPALTALLYAELREKKSNNNSTV